MNEWILSVPLQSPSRVWSGSDGLLSVWTQSALSSSFWIIPQMLISSKEHWSRRVCVLAGTGDSSRVNIWSSKHHRDEQEFTGETSGKSTSTENDLYCDAAVASITLEGRLWQSQKRKMLARSSRGSSATRCVICLTAMLASAAMIDNVWHPWWPLNSRRIVNLSLNMFATSYLFIRSIDTGNR